MNQHRWVALALALPTTAVMGVARWLEPSPSGMGTHTQLGMSRCGFLQITDIPCPSCGMTTAFANVAHGNFWVAFYHQPAGFVLAVLTAMLSLLGIWGVVTGKPVGMVLNRTLAKRSCVLALIAVLAIGWGWRSWQHISNEKPPTSPAQSTHIYCDHE